MSAGEGGEIDGSAGHEPERVILPPSQPVAETDPKSRANRLHHFALAAERGEAAGPLLDPQAATSMLADALRQEGVEEQLLAEQVSRGLKEAKPGSDHLKYLNLARNWLGYRDPEAVLKAAAGAAGAAAGSTLASAMASAMQDARAAGLLDEKASTAKRAPEVGEHLIEVIDARRVI